MELLEEVSYWSQDSTEESRHSASCDGVNQDMPSYGEPEGSSGGDSGSGSSSSDGSSSSQASILQDEIGQWRQEDSMAVSTLKTIIKFAVTFVLLCVV